MLALEIEWLTGVAFLARDPASREPDWPPQPDRVFSALVASWGARGARPEERAALEWLEAQPRPDLAAAEPAQRAAVTVFVPPNDDAGRIEVLPERRRRQPRLFPAARLPDGMPAHLRLTWATAPDAPVLDGLSRLAGDTSYLGHSSSLVRCRFTNASDAVEGLAPHETSRAPYPGRLDELEALFKRHEAGDERARPKRSPALAAGPRRDKAEPNASVFASEWTVLAHAGGDRPDLRAAAGVARRLREPLMSRWPEQPLPEWLSGHAADGSPSSEPHIAIVPLADVGQTWSDGHLMGLGLVVPRSLAKRWDDRSPKAWSEKRSFDDALSRLDPQDRGIEQIDIALEPEADGRRRRIWSVSLDQRRDKVSLRPGRYCEPARRFATITPIALDHHPKSKGPERLEEAAEIIAASCERIGLPRPAKVTAYKHSALQGAPSAWPTGGSPAWQNWARPKSLAGRPLVHAVIEFGEDVQGPVILGAGRFFGLGLCLPLPDDGR